MKNTKTSAITMICMCLGVVGLSGCGIEFEGSISTGQAVSGSAQIDVGIATGAINRKEYIPLGRKENGVKYTDRVKVYHKKGVDVTPPKWFKPSKNFDITYRRDVVLPYTEDRKHNQYLVIPRLGIVTPLIYHEYKGNIDNFNQEDLMKSFEKGSALYPQMAKLGEKGNSFIGGHSNYYTRVRSHYKTTFGRLPELDPGDEIRGYERKNGKRKRYRYIISKSFAMRSFDEDVVDEDFSIAEMTLYTCIPIGTSRDRWIVKAEMKEERDLEKALKDGLWNQKELTSNKK